MYHVGIVVPDLHAARDRLHDLIGVSWGPIVEQDLDVRDGDGNDLTVPLKMCYSTAFPYLELIEESPGTIWECNDYSNLHHIGFYSDALAADSKKMSAGRCPLAFCGRDEASAPYAFTYHRDLGILIEFVDAAMREASEAMLTRPVESS